jgi:hypothetical protein
MFEEFSKICREGFDKSNGYFTSKSVYIFHHFFRSLIENIETRFMSSNFLSLSRPVNRSVYEIRWVNISRTGQTTDESMALELSMLDTLGYKRILGIYDSYCFSTAAMVA